MGPEWIQEKEKLLAEIFKSIERNPNFMRGFYVMRMKKDQRTGHYVGVATWIPRDNALAGRLATKPANNGNGHSETIIPTQTRKGLEEHPSQQTKEIEQDAERPYQAPEMHDERSEIPRMKGNETSERKINRSWYSDDAYEL